MPDFYLTSYDREPPLAPRRCTVLRRLHYGARDDVALVSVDPPFEREAFATQAEVSDVALASRHQGHTLFPVTEWPLHVYVCLPKDRRAPWPAEGTTLPELTIAGWGLVHRAPPPGGG